MSALTARPRLQEIGTSYVGKEGFETVADILRTVTRRLTGAEWGFESCLTTRPFSILTYDPSRPGRFGFGVSKDVQGSFGEAIDLMRELGFAIVPADLSRLPAGTLPSSSVTVLGPVEVAARWVPPEARVLDGKAQRYLVVEEKTDDGLLRCFDPLFGGFIEMNLRDISRVATEPPECVEIHLRRRLSSARAVAQVCWQRGRDARIAASDSSRDGEGIRQLIQQGQGLLSGSARLRLSLSLQEFQRVRYHYSSLLGYAGVQNSRTFKIADLLYAQIVDTREALHFATTGSWAELQPQLETLARLDETLTILEMKA